MWNVTPVVVPPGAPNITDWYPVEEIVNNTAGESRTFNVIANQTVNVNWYINGSLDHTNTSVSAGINATYMNASASEGYWNVSAIAVNANGTAMHTWMWNVTPVVVPVSITDFWIENTPANKGQEFRARLNLTTTAEATEGWYVIVVSGTEPEESEGIAGVGTIYLTPSGSVNNMPVLVHISALAKTGDYNLIASVRTLAEYPDGLITYEGPRTATVE